MCGGLHYDKLVPTMASSMTGSELSEALRAAGYSQKQFAKKIRYSEVTVSRWVRGHWPVPPVIELAVAELSRVPRGTAETP